MPAWSPPAQADPPSVSLELNKLEPHEKSCRAYLVVNNHTDAAFQSVKLDLVMFQSDGVIGRRFALELAPLRPKKRTVKLFDLDGVACERVGSFLLNDVIECQTDSARSATALRAWKSPHSARSSSPGAAVPARVKQPVTSAAAALAQSGDFTITALFINADPVVKAVIVALGLVSVASWAIILEKAVRLAGLRRDVRRLEEAARGLRRPAL